VRLEDWQQPAFKDQWTRVSVMANEELPRLKISRAACDRGYSQFPASEDYGRIFFLQLRVESD
jgi:hypothetical protein